MSEFIIEKYQNPTETIMLNRRVEREKNRVIDVGYFEKLIDNPMNVYHRPKYKKLLKSGKAKSQFDHAYDEQWKRGDKLTALIVRLYQDCEPYTGAETEELVTLDMISHLASTIVNGPIEYQLQVCKEPNNQSMDERVQFDIRKKFLLGWNVNNLNAGKKTLSNGEIVPVKKSEAKARSIDFMYQKQGTVVYDFAKFAQVAGGVQSHQVKESQYFIDEVKKRIDKYPDSNEYFVDTLDGAWAETQIPKHKTLIAGYEDRIFAGNTESVIDWVLALATK